MREARIIFVAQGRLAHDWHFADERNVRNPAFGARTQRWKLGASGRC
jgi:hypothetical protein